MVVRQGSTIAALVCAALALAACGPLRGQPYHEPAATKAAPVSPQTAPAPKAATTR